LQPVIKAASGCGGDLLDSAVIEKARMTAANLKEMTWAKEWTIVYAYYSLKSGLVSLNPQGAARSRRLFPAE